MTFDDALIYQLIDTVTVLSADRIRITFRSGLEMEQTVYRDDR